MKNRIALLLLSLLLMAAPALAVTQSVNSKAKNNFRVTGNLTVDGTSNSIGGSAPMSLGNAQAVTGVKTFAGGADVNTFGNGTQTFLPEGMIAATGTAVSTAANTTETDGFTYTLPANSLSANNKAVRLKVWGTTGATANNKTVKLYLGATQIYTTGAVAANAKPWHLELIIIRTGVGTQTVIVNGQFNATPVAAVTTATADETTALVIKNTMTNGTAAASDCTTSAATLEAQP